MRHKETNKYKYDGHSNPWVWMPCKPKKYESFENMLQDFLKSSKEKLKNIKTEFINNTQLDKLALKKAKKRQV